jgi:hypothetical protein
MTRRNYLVLYLLALAALALVASLEKSPGYMDADYYQLTGQQLTQGHGFTEPVLWNYLDDPQGLPHPSHAYWMPLASLMAAASMRATGAATFAAGRVLFILLAAAIAPLSASLAFALTKQSRLALFAGGLAILSAFYLPYLVTTDSFGISMLLGGFFFLIIIKAEKGRLSHLQVIGLGILAGLMHLGRVEGLPWLLVAAWAVWILSARKSEILLVLAGYLLIMGPWMLRDWSVFGTVLASGTARTLWLTNYNELFTIPANQLTAAHWLASGWGAILQARIAALGQNLLSALTVQGLVFLAPLIAWGARKMRKQLSVRAGLVVWAALLVTMSFVFPFSGARGGFFHAAAALQPFIWALAAVGLQEFVEWGAARRNWQPRQAFRVLGVGALVLALALSAYVIKVRVIGDELNNLAWNQSAEYYVELGHVLDQMGITADEIIMVNNPPGFALATGRTAIVIPNGGVEASLAAARRYGAGVLLLESNHPVDLDELYNQPQTITGLDYISTVNGTDVFFIP